MFWISPRLSFLAWCEGGLFVWFAKLLPFTGNSIMVWRLTSTRVLIRLPWVSITEADIQALFDHLPLVTGIKMMIVSRVHFLSLTCCQFSWASLFVAESPRVLIFSSSSLCLGTQLTITLIWLFAGPGTTELLFSPGPSASQEPTLGPPLRLASRHSALIAIWLAVRHLRASHWLSASSNLSPRPRIGRERTR